MSLILDALKKAESERAQGALPGLATSQVNSTLYIERGTLHPAWWLLAAALVAVALAYGFWPAAPNAAPGPSPVAVAVRADVALSGTAPVRTDTVAAPPAAKPAMPAAIPVAVLVAAPVPVPLPASAAAALTAASPATPSAAQSRVVGVTAPPAPSAVKSAVAPVAPSATALAANRPAPGTGPIPLLAELPDSLRRQMPALHISGAVYSDTPPEWTLVVNDQVLGRGGQVAPELRLEEVSASSAVFSFRGQLFRVDR